MATRGSVDGDPRGLPTDSVGRVTTVDEGGSLQDEALTDNESQGTAPTWDTGDSLLSKDYVDLRADTFCRVYFDRKVRRKTVRCVCGQTLPCARSGHGDKRVKGGNAVAPPGTTTSSPPNSVRDSVW